MTEYTVGLKYVVNSSVGDPLKYADRLASALGKLESRAARSGGAAGGFQRFAASWQRIGMKMLADEQKRADAFAGIWDKIGQKMSAGQARAAAQAQREASRSAVRTAAQAAKQAAQPILGRPSAGIWGRIGLRMQKDQMAALKAARPGVSSAFSTMWQQIGLRMMADQTKAMKAAAAASAKAAEQALHKSYYGGHKSIRGLLAARADNKAKGLATGAADAILNAPGRMISGAFGAAGALAEGAASAAFNFGKMAISAQAMREDSVSGFTAVFGSADEANRLFDAARTAAKQTKFDTQDVVKDFNTIAAAGFGAKDIERIYWTAADVGSARGNQKQQQYMRGLSKLNAQDSAMFGTFQQAAMAGPGLKNAEAVLAQKLGIKGGNVDGTLRSMFRGHQVKGNVALESVIESTNQLYNKTTGMPGEYAKALGDKSWAGTISNIKNGLGDVLNMKLDANHPINKFKEILQAIGSSGGLFDETSERGKRFAALMGRFAEDVFSIFGGLGADTGQTMDNLLALGEQVEKAFRKVTHYIRYEMVDQIMQAINAPNIDGALTSLAAKITVIIGKGVWMGVQRGVAGAIDSLPGAETLNKWFADPDFDKKKYGSPTSGGAVPSMASGGIVPGPFGRPRMIEAHGGEVISGLHGEYAGAMARAYPSGASGMGGGGRSISFAFTLPVTTAQDPAELTKAASPMIMADLIPVLDRYFGRAAAQGTG